MFSFINVQSIDIGEPYTGVLFFSILPYITLFYFKEKTGDVMYLCFSSHQDASEANAEAHGAVDG